MKQKANNSIRVVSSNLYTIEVNDKGETISLDLTDSSLYKKLQSTYLKLTELSKEMQERIKNVEKLDSSKEIVGILSVKEKAQIDLLDEFYKESRITIDGFLGEGSCQKIFGDHNFITMFEDLFTALEPCFKEMQKRMSKTEKDIRKKYVSHKGKETKLS